MTQICELNMVQLVAVGFCLLDVVRKDTMTHPILSVPPTSNLQGKTVLMTLHDQSNCQCSSHITAFFLENWLPTTVALLLSLYD